VRALDRPRPVADLPGPWSAEPYLLGELGAGLVLRGLVADDAAVLVVDQPGRERGLFGLGDPGRLAALLDRFAEQDGASEGVAYVTLTRGAWEATSARVALGLSDQASTWDWFWIDREPAGVDPGRAERLPLTAGTTAEVAECLERAHPTASTPPHDERLIGWWGVRDDAGRLVAVSGAVVLAPGLAPHLVSLGVDPAHRGRGLGAVVIAAAVRDCLQVRPVVGPPLVSLGMYADNHVARRLYLGLGFELRHEFASRRPLPA
jgi:GNAT superfamily N-acetyltransferase